jgi:hypothetical protein
MQTINLLDNILELYFHFDNVSGQEKKVLPTANNQGAKDVSQSMSDYFMCIACGKFFGLG